MLIKLLELLSGICVCCMGVCAIGTTIFGIIEIVHLIKDK